MPALYQEKRLIDKDVKVLQEIFGKDQVFVVDENTDFSQLPKLNELFPEDEQKEDETR